MKAVKIIATCFVRNRVVEKTGLVGNPLGFFHHSQNFNTTKKLKHLLQFNINLDKKNDPGCDTDIILVNNEVGNSEGNKFIDSLNGTSIFRGEVKCLHRKNSGMSFGAYNEAYQKFKHYYDYFLFCEDDISIYKYNYMKVGIDLLNQSSSNGFLAYIHTCKLNYSKYWSILNLTKKNAFSCHGAIGLAKRSVLEKISDKNGSLPFNKSIGENYEQSIIHGEIAFPVQFIKSGFRLIDFPKNILIAEPSYDLIRGIKVKKFPNNLEVSIHYFKRVIYILFSSNKYLLNFYIFFKHKLKKFINNYIFFEK